MQRTIHGLRSRPLVFGRPSSKIRGGLKLKVFCELAKRKEDVGLKKLSILKRDVIRLGIPSKGRMADDTLTLLKDCQLSVYRPNPRQYVASIPQVCIHVCICLTKNDQQIPGVEAWFQRATDVVRKLRYGDVDLGIVGFDMFSELAEEDSDLVMIHEALDFGKCHLALGIPISGLYSDVQTLEDLKNMDIWSERRPMRVVTGYSNIARKFFKESNFEHVVLLGGDGALEAAPAMGSADIILDLVSTGVTLRENNLKEIEGGKILESEGVLVGNRQSLLHRSGLLKIVKELIERLDAHLTASDYFSVISNMRGSAAEEVAAKLNQHEELAGLQGPTISPVYSKDEQSDKVFATVICVKKKNLYQAVQQLREMGGSGVLVQPMTYIFDEEPSRWKSLLETLDLTESQCLNL